MNIREWIEQNEAISLFKGGGLGGYAAKDMLAISPTNRVVSVEFARLAIAVRILNVHLGVPFNYLSHIVDMAEEYQLTVGEQFNSRSAFIKALEAQFGYIRPEARETTRRSRLLGV